MDNYDALIGRNIREVRIQRGLSQEVLAKACDFSNTTLSAYENGRKIPSLVTVARIAKQLKVSIERLYYGDENNAFIISESNEGKKIVNSVFFLWKSGVVSYSENYISGLEPYEYGQIKEPKGIYLHLDKFSSQIKRLILSLDEFKKKKDTYPDSEKYLEFLLASVATEINNEINRSNLKFEEKKSAPKSCVND